MPKNKKKLDEGYVTPIGLHEQAHILKQVFDTGVRADFKRDFNIAAAIPYRLRPVKNTIYEVNAFPLIDISPFTNFFAIKNDVVFKLNEDQKGTFTTFNTDTGELAIGDGLGFISCALCEFLEAYPDYDLSKNFSKSDILSIEAAMIIPAETNEVLSNRGKAQLLKKYSAEDIKEICTIFETEMNVTVNPNEHYHLYNYLKESLEVLDSLTSKVKKWSPKP